MPQIEIVFSCFRKRRAVTLDQSRGHHSLVHCLEQEVFVKSYVKGLAHSYFSFFKIISQPPVISGFPEIFQKEKVHLYLIYSGKSMEKKSFLKPLSPQSR